MAEALGLALATWFILIVFYCWGGLMSGTITSLFYVAVIPVGIMIWSILVIANDPKMSARSPMSVEIPIENGNPVLLNSDKFDDDGRPKRTGNLLSVSAHIITVVIGSGVLSLAWCFAQLGWLVGIVALLGFALITWFTSTLLADCYRTPDPVTGTRNYTYMDSVKSILGEGQVKVCGVAQYTGLIGGSIGYAVTGSISMAAIKRAYCFHKQGQNAKCIVSNYPFMIAFAIIEIVVSQIPNLHDLTWLSKIAAIMSYVYTFIGLGLSIAKVSVAGHHVETNLYGIVEMNVPKIDMISKWFQALGNIAFAYAFSFMLVEIQDTLKSSPPENGVMKKATLVAVSTTTMFYMASGCFGYAAFGNKAPGNILTGFGFYDPYWLIIFANICIAVHLVGAYQALIQPFFGFVDSWSKSSWPKNRFITEEKVLNIPLLGEFRVNSFRIVYRTSYVIFTSAITMMFPFFNSMLGLIGPIAFWPLTIYYPIEMYIAKAGVRRLSLKWIVLKIVVWVVFLISVGAATASIQGLIHSFKVAKPLAF